MSKTLTLWAIGFGFVSAIFGLAAAWRIEQMFTADSFSFGVGARYSGPIWDHCLFISFAFGFVGLCFESVAVVIEKRGHHDRPPETKQNHQEPHLQRQDVPDSMPRGEPDKKQETKSDADRQKTDA